MEATRPILTPELVRRIDQVVELLRASRSMLFITGAGLSADSGLPTYRGIGGLYENPDPEENQPIEDLLSGPMLMSRPELVWKHLMRIEQVCRNARPSRGHEIIAKMDSRFERVWVLTQNVDGLHRMAGSKNVIDIHGDFRLIRCTACGFEETVNDYTGFAMPPRCGECGGVLRPDVILFGESLPLRQVSQYRVETRRGFDVIFSIGTTSVFPYISGPVLDAYEMGRPTVEINPGKTELSEFVTVKLLMRASDALEAIWAKFDQ